MILLCKDYTMWYTDCKSNKNNKIIGEEIKNVLDIPVLLEDGITMEHIFELVNYLDYPKINKNNLINIESDEYDDSYEYISIVPKFTLDIKNNGVHLISKSYNCMNIELNDNTSIFIFDYMITKQVLRLEVRIESDLIEYNDAKFFMPSELTLRELLLAISDGFIES